MQRLLAGAKNCYNKNQALSSCSVRTACRQNQERGCPTQLCLGQHPLLLSLKWPAITLMPLQPPAHPPEGKFSVSGGNSNWCPVPHNSAVSISGEVLEFTKSMLLPGNILTRFLFTRCFLLKLVLKNKDCCDKFGKLGWFKLFEIISLLAEDKLSY